jgi:hypothetical protein
MAGAVYKLNAVDPYSLKAAWPGFNPWKLKCDFLVSKFAFKWVSLCRYAEAGTHRRIDIVLVPYGQLPFATIGWAGWGCTR